MKDNSQQGFSAIGIIILLVVVAIIGGGGWFVWNKNNSKKDPLPDMSVSIEEFKAAQAKTKEQEAPTISTYRSSTLDLTFDYPSSWGEVAIADGTVVAPAHGSYSQVTFSNEPSILVNFVTGPGGSPLDGCPTFLTIIKHDSALFDARVVGYSSGKLMVYDIGINQDDDKRNVIISTNPTNLSILRSDATTTVGTPSYTIPSAPGSDVCSGVDITQAQIDEAKSLSRYVIVLRNSFSSSKVKGVNARIKNADSSDPRVKQLQDLLASIK
jgi:hypothetical protein